MKSHEKASLDLLTCIYLDACSMCGVEQEYRDLVKLRSRVEHEGYPFLEVTLPTLGADLESALERGVIGPSAFRSFAKRGKSPRLFRVFFALVFDTSGVLLDKPDPTAIWAIRQLSYTFKKAKEVCNEKLVAHAFKRFKEVERELADFQVQQGDVHDFNRVCSLIWGPLLTQLSAEERVPSHGPGATVDRLSGNRKYKLKRWHDRLEGYFPLFHNVFTSENAYGSDNYNNIVSIRPSDEKPVRVIAVPKTATKPRIIAIEPACMQYCQHAVASQLVKLLEKSRLTKGHINFTDQTVNGKLALAASKDRRNATIDLSDASDRVRLDLAECMFKEHPELWGAIRACRSDRANVDGDIIPLVKFASMGSALCFPIMSMYFYTLCVLGVLRSRKAPLEHDAVLSASRSIYVYGDDLIVPVDHTPEVISILQSFGCKVNTSKTFYRGNFRESCGVDAYAGANVTPVYLRHRLKDDRSDVSAIISMVETSNLFYKNGLWLTATALKKRVEKMIGLLPVTGDRSAGLGWESYTFKTPNTLSDEIQLAKANSSVKARWNKASCTIEYQSYVVCPKTKVDRISSYSALTKFFIEPSTPVLWCGWESMRNLEQSSQHGTATLKRRWFRPY